MMMTPFPDPGIRQKREIMIARIRDIADRYRRVGESGYAVTLEDAAEDLFTFLPYPGLEPINNVSECEIHQIIMQCNTRQKLGSAGGMENFGYLMTCFLTWKRKGHSTMDKIQEILGVSPPVEYARVQARCKRQGITRQTWLQGRFWQSG